MLLPLVLGIGVPMCIVIWGLMYCLALPFYLLVRMVGFSGIARVLEGVGLLVLGVGEYNHEYNHIGGFQFAQLTYFGALCGALSVGFNSLSFLSEKVRRWLLQEKRPLVPARE